MGTEEDRGPTLVTLPAGRLRGVAEGGLTVFRGVPFAAPPVGELRWRPARPHPGWSGTLDATGYGPSAPQPYREAGDPVLGGHGSPPFDEDCLTLNVWTPGADAAARPVLVWIHGGGFVSGSGSMPTYSGESFARDGDLVVVTLNYRLGPLGYLYFGPDGDVGEGTGEHAEESTGENTGQRTGEDVGAGNFWLTDQLAALRWVRENIAAFGGDPDQVTVAGQSGGAVSTAVLAGHPEGRRLFRRAILQSPPFGLHIPDPAESLRRTAVFLEVVGAKSVEELRGVPWPRLVEVMGEMFGRTTQWGYWPTPFLPVLDGVTLERHPADLLLDGDGTDIDVLIGWTREEANFGFALDPGYAAATREQVVARAADTFGGRAAEVYAAYEAARPGARPVDVLMDLISDELFRVPGVELAERRAVAGRPVWAYQFDLPTPAYEGRLAAAHCLELPFVFDNFDDWSHAPFLAGIDPVVRAGLAASMHRAWISFVRTGDPNHAALPYWERYDQQTRATMRFDAVVESVDDLAGPSRRLHGQAVGRSAGPAAPEAAG